MCYRAVQNSLFLTAFRWPFSKYLQFSSIEWNPIRCYQRYSSWISCSGRFSVALTTMLFLMFSR